MKKFKHYALIFSLVLIPSVVFAEVIASWSNVVVRGHSKDKKVIRLNPGTYHFTLKIKAKSKHPKVKFKIVQKNAVVGRKKLFESTYKRSGTFSGTFIVQARRVTNISGAASGRYSPNSASASGSYSGNMENVEATRKISFIIKNKKGKRIKYSLTIKK